MMVVWLTIYIGQKPPKFDDVMSGQPLKFDIEGNLWVVTWLDGRIWTEINVLTSILICLGSRIWIETLCRPEILLYVSDFNQLGWNTENGTEFLKCNLKLARTTKFLLGWNSYIIMIQLMLPAGCPFYCEWKKISF